MMSFNRNPLESNLVTKVEKYLKSTYKHDAWYLKTNGNGAQRSGIPDILICIKGHPIAIETKREDGSGIVSQQQVIECNKMNRAGYHCLISGNMEEIKTFIENIVNI